jgi:hypothetical protein
MRIDGSLTGGLEVATIECGDRFVQQTIDLCLQVTGSIEVVRIPGRELPVRNLSTTMGHSWGLIREQFPVWRGM